MRLEVKITILRKKPTSSSIVHSLVIFLNNQTKIILYLQRPISSHKFKYSSERLVRVLNMYKKEIEFLRIQDCYDVWTYFEWEKIEKEFEIGYFDLFKVRFSREQRQIVKKELNGKLKTTYTKNPSKPKSQMEYRMRAYYGKCKK